MMGTLATVLAGNKIPTPRGKYHAEVSGDIENVDGIMKITRIRVNYHLKVSEDKLEKARDSFSKYLKFCPSAQSIIGCIEIQDELITESP